jgi:hypothetical protein
MQAPANQIRREVRRQLPRLLGDLLDEPSLHLTGREGSADKGVDFLAEDAQGRRWAIEVKGSSRPSQLAAVAQQLERHPDAIRLLVVPFMSPAGAEAAERVGLNWVDLSGNARIRGDHVYVFVQGQPNKFRSRGRPSSPFAPKSARISRVLLLDASRWWLQKDLAKVTGLDDGHVSRVVRRLSDELLLERREREVRPRDPDLLLDSWAEDYRFDRHDIVSGHVSGNGIEVARRLSTELEDLQLHHAFTGLPAAWALDHFARFRLTTVYVDDDPHEVAERMEIRVNPKGANVQIVGPDDEGVFSGEVNHDGLRCVAPVQIYLDLLNLPERAGEAAGQLRSRDLNWHAGPG